MKRILRTLVLIALAILLVPVLYIGFILLRAHGGLPQWEGEVSVPGLDAPVTVVRDEYGIPWIEADTERDLYFAQGFVHAQDRFWQMALLRRRSQGRLAEWFGRAALTSDRDARYWDWQGSARRSWEAFPDEERPLLEAYAAGVNAWLEGPAYRRPPEMKILHVHPEPWRPWDSFLINHQFYAPRIYRGSEFDRQVYAMMGLDSVAFEMGVGQGRVRVPTIIEGLAAEDVGQATAMEDEASASNSWVVSGEHTASGKPLVANDPHVPPTLPSPWQLQHLSWSGGTAVGISAPGLPGLAGGHNGRVAWAFTAAQIDGTDMALLERHPADPLRYRGGAGEPWREFAVRVDTVRVRFGDPVVDTLFTTPQGRVGVPPALARFRLVPDDTHMAELRDVSFDHPDGLALAALRMARANTTQEGLEAAVQGTFPTINFSVADTAGDIGYVTGARIALRPEAHARFVDAAPADDNERSYLPAAANPRVLNPSSGRIVTANQRIVGDTFPHYLSDAFAPPVRALRIHEALDRTPTHDVASFVAMQNDALSPVARELLPLMLVVEPATQADTALLEPLRGWDHTFASDATAPTIFTTWLFNLNRRLMADDLPGLVVFERWWATRRALSGEHPEWCDDRRTEPVETCGELLSASLTDAREALEAARGPDPQAWRFGDTFPTRLGHLGLGGLPGLGGLFSRTVAAPGGFASLFTASLHGPEAPGAVSTISHSSYQGVYDLADLPGGSRYIAPGGASGHFNSPFYDNLTERWAAGERVRLDPATRIEAFALRLFPN